MTMTVKRHVHITSRTLFTNTRVQIKLSWLKIKHGKRTRRTPRIGWVGSFNFLIFANLIFYFSQFSALVTLSVGRSLSWQAT